MKEMARFCVLRDVIFARGMWADSANALFTLSGTPWSRMSSQRCKTKCFLIVLFVIPVVRGATVATRRISHCTATCEAFTCFFAMVGCFIHWCHVKRDEMTRIQSETWASFLSLCSSGGAAALRLFPTEKILWK